jgi:hypothetical protein
VTNQHYKGPALPNIDENAIDIESAHLKAFVIVAAKPTEVIPKLAKTKP